MLVDNVTSVAIIERKKAKAEPRDFSITYATFAVLNSLLTLVYKGIFRI
jgi:hypothetical protein